VAVLVALVLVPLLGKPERIAVASIMPLPPYHKLNSQPLGESPRHFHPHIDRDRTLYQPPNIPTTIVSDPAPPENIDDQAPTRTGTDIPGAFTGLDNRNGPEPPAPIETRPDKPRVVHFTHVDPAMLIHRVEPVYPTLARQTGRSGKVELRAIIATDGTIQSLQVVTGDPLFYQSALDAVRQWRYTPTVLNGQPVEVDTFITVIYNMQR